MDAMDSGDDDPICTQMLEDIRDRSQSLPSINSREAGYKIRDFIKQIQLECKGALKATRKVVKVLNKVFKNVVKYIFKIYHLWENLVRMFPISLQNPLTFLKLQNCQMTLKKPWAKATQKEIKNLIHNQIFIVEYPKKGEPIIPCMGVYKGKNQYDGSLDKLKLRILVRRYLQNK